MKAIGTIIAILAILSILIVAGGLLTTIWFSSLGKR